MCTAGFFRVDHCSKLIDSVVLSAALAVALAGAASRWAVAQEPELPEVTIAATDPDASEIGPDDGVFTFTRSGATAGSLTVAFTVGGSAENGADYEAIGASLTFAAGAATATLWIKPIPDASVEGDETVVLTLSDGSSYTVAPGGSSATVSIQDNTVPRACDPPSSTRCRNQWVIDAYMSSCEKVAGVCNRTLDGLSQACQDACNLADAAYQAICNTTKAACNAVNQTCTAVKNTAREACLLTGFGTGCNAEDGTCRAGCAGECASACWKPCLKWWSDKCHSCVANCSTSCNSRCTDRLWDCKVSRCASVGTGDCLKCGGDCESALDAKCDECWNLADLECGEVCEAGAPPCIGNKGLGEQCRYGECGEGLICLPDITGFEGLGPATLIEALLKSTDLQEAMDSIAAASGVRRLAGEGGRFDFNLLDRAAQLACADGNCRCRESPLQVGEELGAKACLALYRPRQHLQAWLVNQGIAQTDDLRTYLADKWEEQGMPQSLAEDVLNRYQRVAFAYGSGGYASAGIGGTREFGSVYGSECFGCYLTLCLGAMSDLSVGAYATTGVNDASLPGMELGSVGNLEGWSRVFGFGASIPGIEAGVGVSYVFPAPVSLTIAPRDFFDTQALEDQFDAFQTEFEEWKNDIGSGNHAEWIEKLFEQLIPIGRTGAVSIGLGVLPASVSHSLCYTWVQESLCLNLEGDNNGGQCLQGNVRVNVDETPTEGNDPPRAICRDRTAGAEDYPDCRATVSVDWGSWDPEGVPLVLTQAPPGPYSIGETAVTLTASDGTQSDTCDAKVTVNDLDPPGLTCPQDTVHECQGSQQAVVDPGDATATDCSSFALSDPGPASYPLGTTEVEYSATDAAGNTSSCSTQVSVQDTTPPEIVCPARQVVECTGNGQAPIEFSASATDICWGELSTSCVPASGSSFPLGDTSVSCSAEDGSGLSSDCTVVMTVQDTTPPTITRVTPTPDALWPPNHKLVRVEVAIEATDQCDPTLTCEIVAATSNEPDDDKKSPDIQIVGPSTVMLRAERDGTGDGRIYTITVECRDDTGGDATRATTTVTVPHDQGKRR